MKYLLLILLSFQMSACSKKLPDTQLISHSKQLFDAIDPVGLGAHMAYLYEQKPEVPLFKDWFSLFSWAAQDLEQEKAYDNLISDVRVKTKLNELRKKRP